MRAPFAVAALALAAVATDTLSAQTAAKPAPKPMHHESADHMTSGWKELDAFHKLVAETWHPASGANDLAPLRAKAAAMASSAEKLAASAPPKTCDTPVVRQTIKELAPASAKLAESVKANAADAQLKRDLGALHEKFETVEGACSGKHETHQR